MQLELFDNSMGFRPKATALKWWVLLPQMTSTIGDRHIPSLYGNLKSMTIPVLMVVLTIILDAALIYQLDDEGVGVLALFALSVIDFFISFLPIVVLYRLNLYPALIDANLFVLDTKNKIDNDIPAHHRGVQGQYKESLKMQIATYNRKNFKVKVITFLFSLAIVGMAVGKFWAYFTYFEMDIFTLPVGRFILAVILISMITHLFFTKTVITYLLFKSALNKQLKAFRETHAYQVESSEINKEGYLNFHVHYIAEKANLQFIGQAIDDDNPALQNDIVEEVTHNTHVKKYRIRDLLKNKKTQLIYTGLLTDPEISQLYVSQNDVAAKEAVISDCKEIQIAQFSN